ncbi:hypothetical protein AB0J63_20000 [Streptosporangium canum]|uniref:hypothetical protein n=1 Tax=Streptosporangium canum TaxID=324952 RepID=UPI00341B3653
MTERSENPVTALRAWHRPLMVSTSLLTGLVLVAVVGLVLDDRMLLNESVWVKPLKFGSAFAVYTATLAWLLSKLHKARRLVWWLGTAFAVAGILDVGVIAFAAARGTFSHFNYSTDPLSQAQMAILSYGVPVLFLANLIIAILVLFQSTGDRAMTRALRAGLGLATAGMTVPIVLGGFVGLAARTGTSAGGDPVKLLGGHGIGDPDGNGMPLTNWSITGGDLRVPHFVGMHGIHVLLVLVLALSALGVRRMWLRDEKVRARLVGIVALGYTGLVATLTWQAARGQSLIHPDGPTLLALAALATFVVVATAAVVVIARRRPAVLSGVGAAPSR